MKQATDTAGETNKLISRNKTIAAESYMMSRNTLLHLQCQVTRNRSGSSHLSKCHFVSHLLLHQLTTSLLEDSQRILTAHWAS